MAPAQSSRVTEIASSENPDGAERPESARDMHDRPKKAAKGAWAHGQTPVTKIVWVNSLEVEDIALV